MVFETVLVENTEKKHVGIITLNRPEQLNTFTSQMAGELHAALLAIRSPLAVQIAKNAFYQSEDMDYQKQFQFMNEAFARLCTTDDAKEGVAAFLEKRNPQWKLQ